MFPKGRYFYCFFFWFPYCTCHLSLLFCLSLPSAHTEKALKHRCIRRKKKEKMELYMLAIWNGLTVRHNLKFIRQDISWQSKLVNRCVKQHCYSFFLFFSIFEEKGNNWLDEILLDCEKNLNENSLTFQCRFTQMLFICTRSTGFRPSISQVCQMLWQVLIFLVRDFSTVLPDIFIQGTYLYKL